jgi:hypothetical protein
VLPSIVAAQPPASPPRAPRRPISSRWRLPSHHSTASAVFRPNQSPTLHGPSDRSAGGNSTRPPSPLTSNPHSPALPSRLPHPRDFVPWRLSDACRRRAPTPAPPLGRPTNLHMSRHSHANSSSSTWITEPLGSDLSGAPPRLGRRLLEHETATLTVSTDVIWERSTACIRTGCSAPARPGARSAPRSCKARRRSSRTSYSSRPPRLSTSPPEGARFGPGPGARRAP